MNEFIWPVTLITMSVIWAAAWVTVERLRYDNEGFDIDAPETAGEDE